MLARCCILHRPCARVPFTRVSYRFCVGTLRRLRPQVRLGLVTERRTGRID